MTIYRVSEYRANALQTYAKLADAQYDAGITSYQQILDAKRSLFSGQLDYVQTKTAVLTRLVDTYRAMKGGWIEVADSGKAPAAETSEQVVAAQPATE